MNDVELIRPRAWVESNEIIAETWIPINIPELRIVGRALVTSIDECPAMAAGLGSVVTGRFVTRQVNTIARAEIAGMDGTIDIVEGTPTHPFWSVDRNGWAELGELKPGEQLQGSGGNATVLSLTIEQKSVPVYNIEVFGEHVYAVGELGVLVHNTCDPNKLIHIFGKAQHNLGALLTKFKTPEDAFNAVLQTTQSAANAGAISGTFQSVVSVQGLNITVRGIVVNGVVKIGTFFM